MEVENKLKELGLELPAPRSQSVGNFIPAVKTGNLVFLSGHGPGLPGGGFLHVGKLGADVTIEQGYDCARLVMLNLLTSLKGEIGDLDRHAALGVDKKPDERNRHIKVYYATDRQPQSTLLFSCSRLGRKRVLGLVADGSDCTYMDALRGTPQEHVEPKLS